MELKVFLFYSMVYFRECSGRVFLTTKVQDDFILLNCTVEKLYYRISFYNPSHKEKAFCLPPIPSSYCLPLQENLTINQTLSRNETLLAIRMNISNYTSGNWTCLHGTNNENASVYVETTTVYVETTTYEEQPVIELKDKEVCNESSNITLICSFVGKLEHSFDRWTHTFQGRIIRYLDGIFTDKRSTINLHYCTIEDMGNYTCTIRLSTLEGIVWMNKSVDLVVAGIQQNIPRRSIYFGAPGNREELHLYNITHSHYDEIDNNVTATNDNMVPSPLEDTDKDSENSYQLPHVYKLISPNEQ
ncbi:unnamed protein product [Mytilus coruscus]|uniref:Ig-like domain-containing protein n=1 Tax=Mytilus coruscus TaxID=42192 RepID=A0A6J8AAD8_MYTCO|nr:unnamed protein product [Mytilus coruscus]